MEKQEKFQNLLSRIHACTACQGKGNDLPLGPAPIFQAHPEARILIAGQAPGRLTHAQGRPFDDGSGDRLRAWLGVDRATFYDPARFALVPMGFCYPGTGKSGDLPPRPECAALWRKPLLAQLTNLRLTILLGRYAMDWHLAPPKGMTLAAVVQDWRRHAPALVPLAHPSPRNRRWFAQNPWFEGELIPAMQQQVRRVLEE